MPYLRGLPFSAAALHLRMGFLLSQLCRGLCKRAESVQSRPNNLISDQERTSFVAAIAEESE